jgi:hypothetical protein
LDAVLGVKLHPTNQPCWSAHALTLALDHLDSVIEKFPRRPRIPKSQMFLDSFAVYKPHERSGQTSCQIRACAQALFNLIEYPSSHAGQIKLTSLGEGYPSHLFQFTALLS